MRRSLRRICHFILAASASIFLVLVTGTGLILALEPIISAATHFDKRISSEGTVADLIKAIDLNYQDVIEVRKDHNDFIRLIYLDDNRESEIYVDPIEGTNLGSAKKPLQLFTLSRAIHRSLLLKGFGRFLVGLSSVALLLLLLSGVFLVFQRLGGVRHFFKSIIKEDRYKDNHLVYGRWFSLIIAFIAISGTYLFLLRFEVIPDPSPERIDYTLETQLPKIPRIDFDIFKDSKLTDFERLDYPFSSDEEDYFRLETAKRIYEIQQYSGAILAMETFKPVIRTTHWMYDWHTAEGKPIWGLLLALACLAIFYFLYSGFVIFFKGRTKKLKNVFSKKESEYLILVGSENGQTFKFGKWLHNALIKAKKRSHLDVLNGYDASCDGNKKLIILTATYGLGEAPANAKKFLQRLLQEIKPKCSFQYSVVGFGSRAYPEFCKYAYELDDQLANYPTADRALPIHTINNQSISAFKSWVHEWNAKEGIPIDYESIQGIKKKKRTYRFTIVNKVISPNFESDQTFLIELKSRAVKGIQSGDLLGIYPKDDRTERLYSIAKLNRHTMLLCIKLHEKGLISNYLYKQKIGDTIEAFLQINAHFHLPKHKNPILLIANGTGIAPFLGMLHQSKWGQKIHLYWGGQSADSENLFYSYLEAVYSNAKLKTYKPAYSREGLREYIYQILILDAQQIVDCIQKKGGIMVCGSLQMEKDVMAILNSIFKKHNLPTTEILKNTGVIKSDCY